ncbi:hypothetical protein [Candidatus Electronema sp. JM]|uniref:hypothetical protein n=1 Tax=Candidatus Electronema sp. JM TaxID=3401571 RepID=UPI003AA887C4
MLPLSASGTGKKCIGEIGFRVGIKSNNMDRMMKFYRIIISISSILILTGCSESQVKVDDELLNSWIASIQKGHSSCKEKGCRDVAITCVRTQEVSKADNLNGIQESKLIGMSFVGFYRSEYTSERAFTRFKKKNGAWQKLNTYGLTSNIHDCTYF